LCYKERRYVILKSTSTKMVDDMSRSTNFFGLSADAKAFLKENVATVETNVIICPHCGQKASSSFEEHKIKSGRVADGLYEEVELWDYHLKDGSVAHEITQASRWSSGPMIFMCLEVGGKKVGMWTKKEINSA
jgi:predicted Fe-Mo cluster-binding NifX family protein